MNTTSNQSEIEAIGQAVFRALREMDASCARGLCAFVSCSPFAGQKRKDEAAITWGVTKSLQSDWSVEQCEHQYPEGGGRCDRVLDLSDGSRLWLEVKLAWRAWFYDVVKHNAPFMYNGYFGGDHHSHSVAGDFAKLERINATHARYAALLIVGFDLKDSQITPDVLALTKREQLAERGWRFMADSWPTQQSIECWHRCWFAWRG